MAKYIDWIPSQEEKLVILIVIWRIKLPDPVLQALYAWFADECAQTESVLGAFIDARTAYQSVPTKANLTEKNERKKAAIEAMRKFARERIRNNNAMSNAQKQELGITASGKEPSPVPVPDAGPESEAIISAHEPGVVKVRYMRRKPYGVDWVEIAWLISDTVVDSPDRLGNKDTFSRNPWQHTFAADERAKKLYYSLRYITKKGASHWSDVREVIIP
jgi:hypothetical protein